MNDRIVDVVGDRAQACAQFNYRGYWISFSCIFENQVAVFEKIDGEIEYHAESVEDAIEYIDEVT